MACAAIVSSAASAAEQPRVAMAKPPSTADAIVGPTEEAELLKRVVWPTHEPLAFLERRDGVKPAVRADYARFHTPENVAMIAQLLGPGGMYLSHFYKGLGLRHEADQMERGLALAAEMRRHGMAVCLYIGGTLHSPTVYQDHPDAREWLSLDADGKPIPYHMPGQVWRHYPCIHNPDYRAFVRRLCDIAIERADPEMIWFDNNSLRPEPQSCRCRHCLEKFPRWVTARYSEKERVERFGRADLSDLRPPDWPESPPPHELREISDPVAQEWIDYRCEGLRDFFAETSAYIRKRGPDCVIGLNIKGIHPYNQAFAHGVDLGRWDLNLLNSCDAGLAPAIGPSGNLIGEFRTFKLSHSTAMTVIDGHSDMGNLLGIVINRQFVSRRLGSMPANGHAMYTFGELGRFLKTRNATLYGQRPIYMDVAVLRSWPAMAYNSVNWLHGPFICEQGLWQSRIPFGIIFDRNLRGGENLASHRVVLLANQDALADEAVAKLRAFVESGGGLVATDETGRFDAWRRPRTVNVLTQAFGLAMGDQPERKTLGRGRVAYLPRLDAPTAFRGGEALRGRHADTALPPRNWPDVEAALRWAAGGSFRFSVQGPSSVAAEFREGPSTQDRVVHLINFANTPVTDPIQVEMDDEGREWTVELDSPDPLPKGVPVLKRFQGRVTFTVPGIVRYTACILRPAVPSRPLH